jgi:hypothetical protein
MVDKTVLAKAEAEDEYDSGGLLVTPARRFLVQVYGPVLDLPCETWQCLKLYNAKLETLTVISNSSTGFLDDCEDVAYPNTILE